VEALQDSLDCHQTLDISSVKSKTRGGASSAHNEPLDPESSPECTLKRTVLNSSHLMYPSDLLLRSGDDLGPQKITQAHALPRGSS
jgi:hypothetical protein